MAKELPYFRFTVSEWLNDDISLLGYAVKGVFSDVCSYYWFKDCSITLTKLELRFNDAKGELKKLIDEDIIKVSDCGEFIEITFLNEQYNKLSDLRDSRVNAGRKGGLSKARAKLEQKSSYKDKDKDKDKDYKETFNIFWDNFHTITKMLKSDKDAAFKKWKLLSKEEKQKALDNIKPYYLSLKDKKFCKKARTYLGDKNFNDEFKKVLVIDKNDKYRLPDKHPNQMTPEELEDYCKS